MSNFWKSVIIIFLILLVVWLLVDWLNSNDEVVTATPSPSVVITPFDPLESSEFPYRGNLIDVSGSGARGTAIARFKDGKYQLEAKFIDLPTPGVGFFYEGWVINQTNGEIISTGYVVFQKGGVLNIFISDRDLTTHSRYVLTLEPDDGDPAPAEHILEGTLIRH